MKIAFSKKNLWDATPAPVKQLAGTALQYIPLQYLLGRRFRKMLSFLNRSQWWSHEQIRDYQQAQLSKSLRFAYQNSPYFHTLFDEHRIDVHDPDSFRVLASIPISDRAREAVDRAIEINPDLAEAHMTRGHLLWEHLFEIEEAGRSLDRAVELNPSLAYAYGLRAYYFESLGRYEESVAAARKTIELEPNFLFMQSVIYEPLVMAEKFEEALAQIENARQKFPAWKGWRYQKSLVLERQEKPAEALASLEEEDSEPLSRREIARKTWLLVKLDRRDEAAELFEEYKVLAERDSIYEGLVGLAFDLGDTAASLAYIDIMERLEPRPVFALAPLYALHGNLDQAFACLEEAYERKINWITRLGIMPTYDPSWAILAEDPRYEELMKKIGIRT